MKTGNIILIVVAFGLIGTAGYMAIRYFFVDKTVPELAMKAIGRELKERKIVIT